MNNENHHFWVDALPVANGDSLLLTYGDALKQNRILVDGGPIRAFPVLESALSELGSSDRIFELVVLTHVDTDHIEGLIRLFNQRRWLIEPTEIWFNGWRQLEALTLDGLHGEFLIRVLGHEGARRVNLHFDKKAVVMDQDDGPVTKRFDSGLSLTVLSPRVADLKKLKRKWTNDLAKRALTPNDWDRILAEMLKRPGYSDPGNLLDNTALSQELINQFFLEEAAVDKSVANGSSIAFLAEFRGTSLLMLGDAHDETICGSIRKVNKARDQEKLLVDLVKVSHHGSKRNISAEFFSLVESSGFLITTDGSIHGHPDEEAIWRIIRDSSNKPPKLFFNCASGTTLPWRDTELQKEFCFDAVFPEGTSPLRIVLR